MSKGTKRVHWKRFYEDNSGVEYKRDVYADNLVAQTFLEPVKGKNKVYHIDGDSSNSKYNNLIYVSNREFYNLRNKKITVEDLGREQKYVPFLNRSRMKARRLWNDMYSRCYNKNYIKDFRNI